MSKVNYSFRTLTFKLLLLFVVSFITTTIHAQMVISGGTNVRIGAGAVLTSTQNLVVGNGAELSVVGSLVLKNNLTNQNITDDLGTGIIEFSGAVPQTISGVNTIGNLNVNNATSLDIAGNTFVNSVLNLMNGYIRLGTNNLILGSLATVAGTPSATAMVIATGTGELRKSFSGNGSFTYPVGDDSSTAEYSPVTLNFTGGTFSPVNYVGVKLSNSAYPGLSGNYLSRYWTLTQNGITSPQYNALFQYLPADINGNESGISCAKVDPAPKVVYSPANIELHQLTANGLTTSGTFTGVSKVVQDIALMSGWNIISANVVPDNLDLNFIFKSLIDEGTLKKVMDETGKAIENIGTFGRWKNNIGNLNSSKGYKVYVTAACTLSIEGVAVQLPIDINLAAGWNIMSYPCTTLQDAIAIVQPLIDANQLKKVMDEGGKPIENIGTFGEWKNSIGNFAPGKGYKVYTASSCTLTISATATKSAAFVSEVLASTHFTKVFEGNGTDHFNIYIVDLKASGLRVGDQIGIFDGKYCVGSATIGTDQIMGGSISIPTSSNDGMSEKVNGFSDGHSVELQLYRGEQTYKLNMEIVGGSKLFEKNGSLLAKVSANEIPDIQINDGLDGMDGFKCYPNPFVSEVTIDIFYSEETEISVAIYNLVGQQIKQLYKGTNKGNLILKWNGTNDSGYQVVPGVYLCKVNDMMKKVVFDGVK